MIGRQDSDIDSCITTAPLYDGSEGEWYRGKTIQAAGLWALQLGVLLHGPITIMNCGQWF